MKENNIMEIPERKNIMEIIILTILKLWSGGMLLLWGQEKILSGENGGE